jgi:hypothetical protein
MQQTTLASVAWEKKGKITQRERFLSASFPSVWAQSRHTRAARLTLAQQQRVEVPVVFGQYVPPGSWLRAAASGEFRIH